MNNRVYSLLEQLKRYHREYKDYIMPVWMPFIAIIMENIGIIILAIWLAVSLSYVAHTYEGYPETQPSETIATFIGLEMIGYMIMILGVIMMIYIVYKWIDRRNKHFERMSFFMTTLSDLISELGFHKAEIIKSKVNEIKVKYEKKSAGLFAILSAFIPFVVWYVFHFLNKDFVNHSKDEKIIYADLYEELTDAGINITRRPEEFVTVPDRSTFLYIILSIITFGIFYLYWVYTLTKDPNEHFKSHRIFEAEIIRALEDYIKQRPGGESTGEEVIV